MNKPRIMISHVAGKEQFTCVECGENLGAEYDAINHDCRTADQKAEKKPKDRPNRKEWMEFLHDCLRAGRMANDAAQQADIALNEMRKRGY